MNRLTIQEFVGECPIYVFRKDQHPLHLHSHEFSELVIVLGGKGIHFTKEDEYEISTGDCFMAVGVHGYKNTENLRIVNIMFVPDRIRIPWKVAQELPGYHAFFSIEPKYRKYHNFKSHLHLTTPELSSVDGFVINMEKQIGHRKPGHEFAVTAYFMELVHFLSDIYSQKEDKLHLDIMSLSDIIRHMERNYFEQVTPGRLAKKACMSTRQFFRIFRKVMGSTPIDYLIHLRIRHACELLVKGNLSITEIAYKVGFEDSNYFTRQFRRVMGMTPRKYSKN